jgi:hypothetical protein
LSRLAAEIRKSGAGPAQITATDADADAAEDALVDRAERIIAGDGSELADFDAADFADFYQMAFGMRADVAGKHWELSDKQARRLGAWTKRVIDKHGVQWVMKFAPELCALLLLGWEIGKRVRIDRVNAAEKKAEAA